MAISQIISLFLLHLLLPLASISLSQSSHQLMCEVGTGNGGSIGGISWLPASLSKLLIKGGTVVNAHRQERGDVYVEDGIIVAVKPNIKVGDEVMVLDATGMPGGIDPHTHLDAEFMGTVAVDDFFSGQAVALAGGTTMHIDFVHPVNGSLMSGFEAYEKKASKSCMDYGFHMVIRHWDESVSKEMEIMVKENGINSFKFFMVYKGTFMVDDKVLLRGMKRCKSLGALAMVHAENGDAVFEGQKRMIELGITIPEGHALSRPPMLEAEATMRAIRLASFMNTPLYVVHVMCIDAMEEIAKARKTGEPVVSGLVLDDSKLWDPDFITAAKYVMSPPIRESGHNKALQAALSTGVLHLVGTDHCTFSSSQKAFGIDDFRKIPNGVNGKMQKRFLYFNFLRISEWLSFARIFNIYPRKGAILVGSDADIIIFNELRNKSKISSFENQYEFFQGKVEVTISRGRIVWKDDELKVAPGSGKYIPMPPFGFLFDGIEKTDAKLISSFKAPVHQFKSDV
ncbi:hypothetical protein ERO13_D08G020300v2 [Gossypium hirsutum]|nr:hypothetical protein ERO13_D08G020300v2 [Gossypium hirsutum]